MQGQLNPAGELPFFSNTQERPRRFDWVLAHQPRGPHGCSCDVDLTPEQPIATVPTIGPLVNGWVLLIPRRSALNARCLPPGHLNRLASSIAAARARLAASGEVFFFEHGATTIGSDLACGVDQAHVHVVPLQFDLLSAALATRVGSDWFTVDPVRPWSDIDQDRPYYIVSNTQEAYAAYPRAKQPQFFRQVIASRIGASSHWDYRSGHNEEYTKRTIALFRSA